MRVFVFILIFLVGTCVNAQVLPNQFPEKTEAEDTDEIYSQAGGTAVRITFETAKNYFAPEVELTPISYTPSSTGNINDRAKFVIDPNGDVFYIDGKGKGINLTEGEDSGYITEEFANLTSGNSITATGNLPSNTSKIEVTRGGISVTQGRDFTRLGQTFTFIARDFEDGEIIKLRYKL